MPDEPGCRTLLPLSSSYTGPAPWHQVLRLRQVQTAPQEAGRTCKHIEAVKFHIFGFEAQPKQLPPGPAILPEVTPEAVRMAALRGLDDLLGELQEATQYTERLKQLFSAGDMAPCLGLISDCKRKAKDIVLSVGGAICQMFHDQVYTQTSLIFFFFFLYLAGCRLRATAQHFQCPFRFI